MLCFHRKQLPFYPSDFFFISFFLPAKTSVTLSISISWFSIMQFMLFKSTKMLYIIFYVFFSIHCRSFKRFGIETKKNLFLSFLFRACRSFNVNIYLLSVSYLLLLIFSLLKALQIEGKFPDFILFSRFRSLFFILFSS